MQRKRAWPVPYPDAARADVTASPIDFIDRVKVTDPNPASRSNLRKAYLVTESISDPLDSNPIEADSVERDR